jgi:hypothetical protein
VQAARGEGSLRRRQLLAEGHVTPGEAQPEPWWTIESIVFDFDLRPVAVEFLRIRAPARSLSTMTRSPQTFTCPQSLARRSMQRTPSAARPPRARKRPVPAQAEQIVAPRDHAELRFGGKRWDSTPGMQTFSRATRR